MAPTNPPADNTPAVRTHVISVLVENEFGVLARICALFASRGFNIDSLAVGPTHDPSCSRMTIVATGDPRVVEQIQKQLNKLIEVIKVVNLTTSGSYIDRELVLIKVTVPPGKRTELIELSSIFKAKAIDISSETLTLEITGHQEKIETFLEMLAPYGLLEVARTGRIALLRGPGGLHSSFVRGEGTKTSATAG